MRISYIEKWGLIWHFYYCLRPLFEGVAFLVYLSNTGYIFLPPALIGNFPILLPNPHKQFPHKLHNLLHTPNNNILPKFIISQCFQLH